MKGIMVQTAKQDNNPASFGDAFEAKSPCHGLKVLINSAK